MGSRRVGRSVPELLRATVLRAVVGLGHRAVYLAVSALTFGVQLVNNMHTKREVSITAHRGASREAPENSLSALRRSIELQSRLRGDRRAHHRRWCSGRGARRRLSKACRGRTTARRDDARTGPHASTLAHDLIVHSRASGWRRLRRRSSWCAGRSSSTSS